MFITQTLRSMDWSHLNVFGDVEYDMKCCVPCVISLQSCLLSRALESEEDSEVVRYLLSLRRVYGTCNSSTFGWHQRGGHDVQLERRRESNHIMNLNAQPRRRQKQLNMNLTHCQTQPLLAIVTLSRLRKVLSCVLQLIHHLIQFFNL